ncbi:hypothetical protein [Bacteroides caecimuris]|uniref:hypothetical protein n=2 Tax=Bacteroides caecimuris TaxID=1796613 RepID=UPI00263AB967|nr:hypothetical protein [Bacteroides caecimuris]
MDMIRKYLYRLVPALCIICALSACTAEDASESPSSGRSEGLAVGFTAQYAADECSTKATEGKTAFENGDVIHIAAQFYLGEATQGVKGTPHGATQYCAYRYEKGDWISIMNNHEITWPYACDYGMFTAYYVSHADGAISEEGGTTESCMLSDIADGGTSDNTVPLKAGPVAFRFGHTVNLTFTHLCARLSVTQLDASTVSEYWLAKPDDTGFHNAYRLKRNSTTGVEIEWQSLPTKGYDKYGVYIARSQDVKVPEEYGRTVTFYLEPGVSFSGCKLNYRYNRSYLILHSDKLAKLESNHSYRLNITQDAGIVYDDPDDNGWSNPDDDTKAYELKNIPAFLKAASTGTEYAEKNGEEEVQILQKTGTGVILLRDLNFKKRDPMSAEEFDEPLTTLCNLETSVTFDGDFHYIYNSVRPIFNEVQGRLYNIGVSKTERTGGVHAGTQGYGGLSRSVISSGTISNVRISNLQLTLNLPSKVGGSYSIGCVTGINRGQISDIGVRGNIHITLTSEKDIACEEIFTGGIIGQNLGVLSGCSSFTAGDNDNTSTCIYITNSCTNNSPMSTGGIVGASSNHIENVTLTVNVDACTSTATVNCTGGMAGRLRRTDGVNERKDFKNISVTGSVTGGQGIFVQGLKTGKSFTGGISGRLFNFFIDNCNSLCEVHGWNGEIQPNVRYATGGAFGCIATSEVQELVFNTTWWGNALSGLSTNEKENLYLGTFSGIIPTHRTDAGYQENGNNTKEQSGISFSGGQFDDESTGNGL